MKIQIGFNARYIPLSSILLEVRIVIVPIALFLPKKTTKYNIIYIHGSYLWYTFHVKSLKSWNQDPWAERVQPAMKSAVLRSLEAVGVLDPKKTRRGRLHKDISHDRSDGTGIFTDPWMVDVYGKVVGKSTNGPWFLWVLASKKSFCSNFLGSPWSWYMSYLNPQNMRGTAHDCSRQSQGLQVMHLQSWKGVPCWWWEPLTMSQSESSDGQKKPWLNPYYFQRCYYYWWKRSGDHHLGCIKPCK